MTDSWRWVRCSTKRRDDAAILFHRDHGHELLSGVGRGTHPGYPVVGRMRGLANFRGTIEALSHAEERHA